MNLTISCLIKKDDFHYYNGDTWRPSIRRACLYTVAQAENMCFELNLASKAEIFRVYVIQNADFNYYDGKEWAYELSDAKLYGLEDAQTRVKAMSAPRTSGL